ncbi:MAG: glycosyltransferase, exosortase A system-associated [Magnetococcales bacterium]|nr:glycosyltransferase, exosortase A system-associated [Magnetococcales bacterium]
MRILHILDHSAPLQSGYVFRTLAILRQQREFGWEPIPMTGPKHPFATSMADQEGEWLFHRTAPERTLAARLPILRQSAVVTALEKRILELAEAYRPDLLHAHSPVLNGLAALRAGRRLGIPVVYEIRAFWEDAAASHGTGRAWGARYRLTRALETLVARRARAVTVICEGLRRDLTDRGIPADKITIVPNAVDAERFRPPPPAPLPGLTPGDGEILLYLGSFYAYEGLSLLLDALPAILARRPRARLVLVGGGPEEERLRLQADRMGVTGHVLFTGRAPPELTTRYYALADLLVYPRLPMRLTQLVTPLKPLEAMAAGRLVVASNVGGHQELIAHGETGFLFPAGRAGALADTIVALLEDRSRWEPVLRRAGQFVREARNWRMSVAGYRQVYDAACPAPRNPDA